MILALKEVCGDEGTIFMPALRLSPSLTLTTKDKEFGLTSKIKILPEEWLVETGEPPVKGWYTIQAMAYKKVLIKDGYIGNCKYMFFSIKEVVSLYKHELEINPFKLYGIK